MAIEISQDSQRSPLSPQEAFVWRLHQRTGGDGSGAVVLWLDGVIDRDRFRAALHLLQSRHPKLRSRIVEDADAALHYQPQEPYPEIPLSFDHHAAPSPPWDAQTLALLERAVELNEPAPLLADVQVVAAAKQSVVTLLLSHVVYDGMALQRIAGDLLEFYAALEAGETAAPQSRPFVSVGKAETRSSLRSRLRLVAGVYRRQREFRGGGWERLPPGTNAGGRIHLAKHEFDPSETLRLARACRSHGIAGFGLMMATAAAALRSALDRAEVRMRSTTPVDIRRSAGVAPAGDDLGPYFGIVNEFHRAGPDFEFWDFARRSESELAQSLAGKLPQILYNLPAYFPRMNPDMTGQQRPTISPSWGISLLPERYGSLRLAQMVAVPKCYRVGPSIIFSGLVLNRRLTLIMMGNDLASEFWSRFSRDAVDCLRQRATAQEQAA